MLLCVQFGLGLGFRIVLSPPWLVVEEERGFGFGGEEREGKGQGFVEDSSEGGFRVLSKA